MAQKAKTYALCKSRMKILQTLTEHKVLWIDPGGEALGLFCECCGPAGVSPATVRILMAAGWIEQIGKIAKANGGTFIERWSISQRGRAALKKAGIQHEEA